jgi:hypothetical protein
MSDIDATTAALRVATEELIRTDTSGLPSNEIVGAVARARLEVQRGQTMLGLDELDYVRYVISLAREEIALRTKLADVRLNQGPRI